MKYMYLCIGLGLFSSLGAKELDLPYDSSDDDIEEADSWYFERSRARAAARWASNLRNIEAADEEVVVAPKVVLQR